MVILIVGPKTEYTAYISEASLELDDHNFYTEEIDFDAPPGWCSLKAAARRSEEGKAYCWLEDGSTDECEHSIADVIPMRIVAIRHNPSDTFVYDIRTS